MVKMFTFASDVRVALVTNWADAIDSIDSLTAFRIDTAFGCVTGLFLSTARLVRIAGCTRIANTSIRLTVFAVRITTARWLADWRNNWRNAEQIRFADEIRQTDALVGDLIATGSHSARNAFAALLTASGNADLRVLTRQRSGTDIRQAGTPWKWVAVITVQASACGRRSSRPSGGNNALGVIPAEDVVAQ